MSLAYHSTEYLENQIKAKDAEIASLHAELAEVKAEGRQEIANVVSSYRAAGPQDTEERARLSGIMTRALAWADDFDISDAWTEDARAALACRPQPARNRPLPETRCDCCDNGLDDAWEFCPFCGQQHSDATDALACRPQGGIEIAEFKPCVVFNEELRLTEMLLEDRLTIWRPWGPYKGHGVDLGYSEDGRLIGIKIWDDVRGRPQGEKS